MNNVGIYIHIPFCKARCGYCTFCSTTDLFLQDQYFDKLIEQINASRGGKISTIFIGGGTPSSVSLTNTTRLLQALHAKFDLTNLAEFTVECNPESTTTEYLALLKQYGVNRISFGLQSVNDSTLKRIGRLHNYKVFLQAFDCARQVGFTNINADLIIGLPESKQEFIHSVQTVCTLPLTHISMYALELYPNSPIYNLCKSQYNFDDDTLADMYDQAVEVMSSHGFDRYEISNFAKSGYPCKHNLSYWQQCQYFGFGVSACGFIDDVRYTNPKTLQGYLQTPMHQLIEVEERLSTFDKAVEYVMLGLRLTQGIDLDYLQRQFDFNFFNQFHNSKFLLSRGLLVQQDNRIFIPPEHIYVTNSILVTLFDND
ncbi:MAG: radical SAM family heme chaperone HemW [Clostridia bacterium]|nr:radical SAM family heme chaperone HemW [Clostridia bacterium]